jgi:hypothetical protein
MIYFAYQKQTYSCGKVRAPLTSLQLVMVFEDLLVVKKKIKENILFKEERSSISLLVVVPSGSVGSHAYPLKS